MHHHTSLIATIVAGLTLAFVFGAVANRFKLSPLVGYLVAGVLIGPFTPGYVADQALAPQLAEIGVILLMFGVGLHFSLKDLLAVRAIALPGAVVQIGIATLLGVGLSWAMGWTLGAGLVFGLALSVASTVVLLRALQERRLVQTERGRIAVGWLIVEDLAMVLALVLLPALSPLFGGASDPGGHGVPQPVADLLPPGTVERLGFGAILIWTLLKVAFFVAFMLVIGRRIIPAILHYVAHTGQRELFRLAVLAISLGVAFGSAEWFGVSFALGAFFAGMVLAESELSHRAAEDILPLRDAFAVLFFVSVGMLFDPTILLREPLAVLATLAIILVGKSLAAVAIVLAFRHPLSTALTIAASLAQIGEFSFILASLGIGLKLLPPEGRDLILAGSLLSITLNPLIFGALSRLAGFVEARPGLAARFERGGERIAVSAHAKGREGHAVVVGYGRVGGAIGKALAAWELPYVVVERDRRRVEELRSAGIPAVFGDAGAPGILDAADIGRARLLVVASPDSHQARRLIEIAREANPGIDTVVRTHSDTERRNLEEEKVGLVLMAEREVGFGMALYALRSLGLGEGEARLFIDTSRADSRAEPAAEAEPELGAPELRPHREAPAES